MAGWDRYNIPPDCVDRFNRLQFDVCTLVVTGRLPCPPHRPPTAEPPGCQISNIRGLRPSTMRSGIPLKSVSDRLRGKVPPPLVSARA